MLHQPSAAGDGEQAHDADEVEHQHDQGVHAHPGTRRVGRKSRPATYTAVSSAPTAVR